MSLTFKIVLKPAKPAARFLRFAEVWADDAEKAHVSGILSVLFWIVYWCRVDTSRLQHGWMPYADSKGYNLEVMVPPTGKNRSAEGAAEGRAQGFYEEEPLHTRIINGVNYGEALDENAGIFYTGPFSSKLATFERIYNDKIQEWLDAADEMNETGKPSGIAPSFSNPGGGF